MTGIFQAYASNVNALPTTTPPLTKAPDGFHEWRPEWHFESHYV